MLKFKIKIVFDFDEDEYLVFADGIRGVEARGKTEEEAVAKFKELFMEK